MESKDVYRKKYEVRKRKESEHKRKEDIREREYLKGLRPKG